MNVNDILAKLPQEVLAENLSDSERAFLTKHTMDLDSLVPEDLSLEKANELGLRIFSLLTGIEAGEEEDLSVSLQALAHFSDKELISLLKKLLKLECYKLRKKKTVSDDTPEPEEDEDNPLTNL